MLMRVLKVPEMQSIYKYIYIYIYIYIVGILAHVFARMVSI